MEVRSMERVSLGEESPSKSLLNLGGAIGVDDGQVVQITTASTRQFPQQPPTSAFPPCAAPQGTRRATCTLPEHMQTLDI